MRRQRRGRMSPLQRRSVMCSLLLSGGIFYGLAGFGIIAITVIFDGYVPDYTVVWAITTVVLFAVPLVLYR